MNKSKHTQMKELIPVQDSATLILGSYTLSFPCATQMVQRLILSCTLVSENLLEQNPPQNPSPSDAFRIRMLEFRLPIPD